MEQNAEVSEKMREHNHKKWAGDIDNLPLAIIRLILIWNNINIKHRSPWSLSLFSACIRIDADNTEILHAY